MLAGQNECFYYCFCHSDSPAASVEAGHDPTGRVVNLHHRLGGIDVHVDHVEVDHGRGGPASLHHVAGHVAVRTVALSGSKGLAEREERNVGSIMVSVVTHLQLGHDLAGVAGGGANLHSELLSQPGDCLGNSCRVFLERERHSRTWLFLPLITLELAGKTSRVADRELL